MLSKSFDTSTNEDVVYLHDFARRENTPSSLTASKTMSSD